MEDRPQGVPPGRGSAERKEFVMEFLGFTGCYIFSSKSIGRGRNKEGEEHLKRMGGGSAKTMQI